MLWNKALQFTVANLAQTCDYNYANKLGLNKAIWVRQTMQPLVGL